MHPTLLVVQKLSKMRFGSRFSRRCFQQITIDIPLVENVIASNIVQNINGVKWQDPSSFIGGKHIKNSSRIGGSDAFIILNSKILKSCNSCHSIAMLNAGPTYCAKRFIVVDEQMNCCLPIKLICSSKEIQ
jgi:succinate-semialdehyde dehydrogenase/glutarate-semialdehyde dehydrogenase